MFMFIRQMVPPLSYSSGSLFVCFTYNVSMREILVDYLRYFKLFRVRVSV